jgi:hypothetical protein
MLTTVSLCDIIMLVAFGISISSLMRVAGTDGAH